MATKADVVFEEVFNLLLDNKVDKLASEKIANNLIGYLRSQKCLTAAAIDDFFQELLEKNALTKRQHESIMEHFSMMCDTCICSCNRCFSELDKDGTAILTSNKLMDESLFGGHKKAKLQLLNKKQITILSLLQKARYHRNISANDKKAIKLCDKILKLDHENRDALLIKAGALGTMGKIDESIALIMKVMEKWPSHWEAYYLFGLRLLGTDDAKSIEHLKKSLELNENFDNLIITAQVSYFMGKNDYQSYLDKAKRLDPTRFKNYMTHYWRYELS